MKLRFSLIEVSGKQLRESGEATKSELDEGEIEHVKQSSMIRLSHSYRTAGPVIM